jgi:hypothetical protein
MTEKETINVLELEVSSWEPMQLVPLGEATSLIQGGSGKVSMVGGDPGDSRKQKAS